MDGRESILLEDYLLLNGDIEKVSMKLGLALPQANRLLKRIQYKIRSL